MTDERQNNLTAEERKTRDAVRSAGDVRADDVFRERLKREFVDGTIREPAAPAVPGEETEGGGPSRWWWALVPAAAAVLLLVLFLPRQAPAPAWVTQAVHGDGEVEIDGQARSTVNLEEIAGALESGGRVRVIEEVALDLLLDDRLLLQLDEGADVTLPVPPPRDVQAPLIAEVHNGELRVKTGPGFPGTEMHIVTSEGRTEIVGTIVSVYKGDGFTCVCVLEGTARIGADESRLEAIPQGMRKVMFADERPPMITEIQPQHEAGLLEFERRYQEFFLPQD